MKVEWHRANGIEYLEQPTYRQRLCFYELPVLREDLSDYLSYPTDTDVGLSLCLTDMKAHRDLSPDYPELLTKKMVWLVKHLCERTDMVEHGVQLRIGITSDLADMAIPYLDACNFPKSVIDWLDNSESIYHYGTKFEAMRQPGFRDLRRVIHMDLTFLIGKHPTQRQNRLFAYVLDRWRHQKMASGSELLHDASNLYACNRFAICVSEMKTLHPIWEILSSIYGIDSEQECKYWLTADPFYQARGGVFGFWNEFLADDAEWDKIFKTMTAPNMCDESAMSLYACYNNWTQLDNVSLSDALKWTVCDRDAELYGTAPFCVIESHTDPDIFLSMHR